MGQIEEKNTTSPGVGVYICHCGGNIGDVVDVEKARETLEKDPQVSVAQQNMFMCSKIGQELIEKDIREGKVDRVVVASCSPRLHQTTFRGATKRGGLNVFLYEHANIREQVSWAHPHTPEKATEKAVSLIRAAVNKAVKFEPLEPIRIATTHRVVVIGAGISGLRAALDLANSGLPVELIEKSPYLGGRMASLNELFPTKETASELLSGIIYQVINHPLINIHLNSTIESSKGYIGNFDIVIKQFSTNGIVGHVSDPELKIAMNACPVEIPTELRVDGTAHQKAILQPNPGHYPQLPAIHWDYCTRCGKCKEALSDSNRIDLTSSPRSIDITAGVIILSTGYDTYIPYEGEFGWNTSPNVITLQQLIRMTAPGGQFQNQLVLNGKPIKSIAFIHCVGSRQKGKSFKPGQNCQDQLNAYCSRVCCTATLQMVTELKEQDPSLNIYNIYRDIRTYGRFHEEDYYDKASRSGAVFLKYDPDALPEVIQVHDNKKNQLHVKVKDQLTYGEELEIPVDLVVLATGMVARDQKKIVEELNLPIGEDRFLLEVHPKLRPVEVANSGIMLAGTCQAPFDTTESTAAALASSAKASIILSKDFTELEPYVARVRPDICTGTGICINECEYQDAIQMVDVELNGKVVQRALVNSALCKGCGACVAVCPHPGAIDVMGYTLESMERMVDGFVQEVQL